MTTKVSDGMTEGLVKTSNLASKTPSSKSSGDEGKVVQLDSSGGIPDHYSQPVGIVMVQAVSAIPSGWLECDGSAVSRTTYATLFTAIGTAYGTGDGSTTFNVPDASGLSPAGLKFIIKT